MRAISLWQPWASAVAIGIKTIETRSWQTWHEGPIAIHAAGKKSRGLRFQFEGFLETDESIRLAFKKFETWDYDRLPFGAVIATANLQECVRTDMISNLTSAEKLLGDFGSGRFGWILKDIKKLKRPIPTRGHQGIFNVDL